MWCFVWVDGSSPRLYQRAYAYGGGGIGSWGRYPPQG